MRLFLLMLSLCIGTAVWAQDINIIPKPASTTLPATPGKFTLSPATTIVLEGSGMENSVAILNDYLSRFYGFKLKTAKTRPNKNVIVLNYERPDNPLPGAYVFNIDKGGIYIAGDNAEGVFYGIQSLIQLLPIPTATKSNSLSLPWVAINDNPRFAYRGLHLDVGRHFFSIEFVKKYIDYMALHKLNYFHWHLTEDQGWRIEIKKYPKLTQVGAYRNGTIIGRYPGTGNDNTKYGGFYTQQQIKEVIAYAKKRYITIIPEIEMPGHGGAAIAAYPFLSCFPDEPTKVPFHPSEQTIARQAKGEKKMVQESWGVFDDVFCAGNDATFTFMQDVLNEVIALFPAAYIHIGGDECPKANWKRCPKCQERMKKFGLKDEHELQSYFVQRIEKYINSKGKKMIGWDEILEGGLAPNATVMSWRGEAGGIAAARQNHDVIMTPTTYCYLDYSQTKNEDSVTIGGYLPLEKVYSYNPVSDSLNDEQAKHILGAQGNLWSEYIGYPSKAEYMIFPRMSALSEVLWTPKDKKDYKDFEKRLPAEFMRLDLWKASYSNAIYMLQGAILPTGDNSGVLWSLSSKFDRAGCRSWITVTDSARTDSEELVKIMAMVPDLAKDPNYTKGIMKDTFVMKKKGFSSEYITPVLITASKKISASLYALCAGSRTRTLDYISQTFSFNKATGKRITLAGGPAEKWPGNGGAFGLVNGAFSDKGINSAEWQGWNGHDMEAVIDLGTAQSITKVNCHVLDQKGSWIYLPSSVEVFTSADGTNFTSAGKTSSYTPDKLTMYNAAVTVPATTTRYIKVIAQHYGKIGDGLPGAGNAAWLFVDEIQID